VDKNEKKKRIKKNPLTSSHEIKSWNYFKKLPRVSIFLIDLDYSRINVNDFAKLLYDINILKVIMEPKE
jgi:hypothetical protein